MSEKRRNGAVEEGHSVQNHDESQDLSGSQTEDRKKAKGLLSRFASEFSFIRGNFLIIIIGWLITDFTAEMAGTYYPLYIQALGGTVATVGLIGSISSVIRALVGFPGGYLADKYGRKRLITSMTFLVSFAFLFYAFAPNWQTILLGAIIRNLCYIYLPAFDAMVMDSLPSERRGMGYSIINLITLVSTTPSPLIAGLLYLKFGLTTTTRIGYVFVMVSFMIAGLLRLRLKETMKEAPQIDRKELLRSFAGARVFVEGIKVWKEVPRTALTLLIISFIFGIPNAMSNVVLVFWVTRDRGFSLVDLSLCLTLLSICMILFSLPIGKLVDKFGKKKPLLLAYILLALTMPLLLYGDFFKILIGLPFIGLHDIIFSTAISALYADVIPQEHRGKISGSRSFFWLISGSIGGIVGGILYDNVSHQLPLLIFWASALPAFLLTLLFIKEPPKKEE